jgi:mono/diheme cytochrome c family protein
MSQRLFLLMLAAAVLLGQSSCKRSSEIAKPGPVLAAYDIEHDWNNPDQIISLNYQQAQGKRIFYDKCVWCHADSTPAGPSNRSNLNPAPALINDGTVYNSISDADLHNAIALGGAAMGKSAAMPPYGRSLTPDEIDAVIAYMRAIAQPPYHAPTPRLPR